MYTSIRHYSLSVEREAASRRTPRAYAIALDPQPSLLDRLRAILAGGRSVASAQR
jgi:hypothetical protein